MRKAHLLYPAVFLSLLLILPVFCSAQTVPESALTNAGVSKMIKAGLPESIILREIQISRTNFDTSAAGLIELRKHGASEPVLNAVLDSWSAGGMPYAEAPSERGLSVQALGPHAPHLPAFNADVKIKKAHEKISMGPNHFAVQGTGVPNLSVEWQTNPPAR